MTVTHIHIHRARTRNAETKHDPKNGQFTSGGGSGGERKTTHKAQAAKLRKQAESARSGRSTKPVPGSGMKHGVPSEWTLKAAAELERQAEHHEAQHKSGKKYLDD